MPMPTSLRVRLIVASLLWVTAGIALAGFILSAAFREHLLNQMQDALAVDLDELRRITTRAPDGHIAPARLLSDPRYDTPDSGVYWIIRSGNSTIAKSRSLGDADLPVPAESVPDGVVHYHVLAGPRDRMLVVERTVGEVGHPDALQFVVASDRRSLKRAMRQFNTTLVWSMGGFAASLIGLAVLLLLYAMRPLTQVQTAIADVRAGRAKQLDGDFPGEVRPLVEDLNGMMDAMGKTTQKARAQAGNLAHSLKTPLAVLTDEAYAVEKAGLKASAEVMFEQCRRMQRQIDYQLARSRSAALRFVPGTVASAADVVESVAKALARLYSTSPVRIERVVPTDLFIAVDRQDLNEILANVLDNALKHAHSRVLITAARRAGGAHLVDIIVEDDGPGLPPEAWNVVFDIGERWDSRAKGTGLGLPIVRDLALLYGGSAELGTSELGGLKVIIGLPAVAE